MENKAKAMVEKEAFAAPFSTDHVTAISTACSFPRETAFGPLRTRNTNMWVSHTHRERERQRQRHTRRRVRVSCVCVDCT